MPNLPQQQTIVQYTTNVSQTQYTFAFYAPLPTDIQVYYQAPNAVPIPATDILLINSQYTVTYNADPTTGGYITLLFTPTTGYYLTINRQVQASLNTNFSNAQNFSGANLDAALDRLLLLCQQNQNYNLQRNLSYIINTYLPNATPYTQLPPLAQNYIWIGSGTGVVSALVSTVPSASVLQSMLANNSPGTDGAQLVGYYDTINNVATTVDAFLQNIPSFISNMTNNYGADTGAVNAMVASNAHGATSLYPGLTVIVTAANTSTSSVTLNWNSLGARPVDFNGIDIIPGGIVATLTYEFIYNGTNWSLVNPTIAFATNTQALSGTDSTHPVTSAGLASKKVLNAPGYMAFPGGMIIQWGVTGVLAPNANTTVTFPIAFPNGCFSAQATAVNSTSGVNSGANISSLTLTTMVVYNTTQAGGGNAVQWMAMGF
jgi:hypothetical protein